LKTRRPIAVRGYIHKRALLKAFKMDKATEGARHVEEALELARKAGDEAQIQQIEETREMIRRERLKALRPSTACRRTVLRAAADAEC
jgi:hypothetical protein